MTFWVAGAVVVGAVVGAVGSNQAADTQASAATNAANMQLGMYNSTVAREAPFVSSGTSAQNYLDYLLGLPGSQGGAGGVTTTAPSYNWGGNGYGTLGGGPINGVIPGGTTTSPSSGPNSGFGSLLSPFTIDTFKQFSPAYQFQLQQGIQGTMNGDSAGAGSLSGAAQKDLISFNQGLANTSFNNAFNQWNTQQNNIYSRLAGVAGTGQAAASNSATGGSSYGGSIGTQIANAGTAQAGGIVGVTNSLGGAASSLPWLLGSTAANNPASLSSSNAGSMISTPIGLPSPSMTSDWSQSDRRLKTDIARFGALASGLPLYVFRYIRDLSMWHVGVMADEAKNLFPDAVIVGDDGYQMVDYARIS